MENRARSCVSVNVPAFPTLVNDSTLRVVISFLHPAPCYGMLVFTVGWPFCIRPFLSSHPERCCQPAGCHWWIERHRPWIGIQL
jgi:hypothetical protein